MWSAIGGLVGTAASSALNAGVQYATSKAVARENYKLGQKSRRNSPSNYKEGLERAGINPILAANSPIGSTQGSVGVNPGVDFTEGATKGNSAKNLNAQTKSNIAYQEKQGDAALQQAGASNAQATASMITAKANAEKAQAEAEYSRALTQTENAIREEKISSEGRKGNHVIYNSVKDAGKRITSLLPAERADSGIIHSAKSVPPDPNKTILKHMSQEEKEKYYLEQIRKNQKHIRSK